MKCFNLRSQKKISSAMTSKLSASDLLDLLTSDINSRLGITQRSPDSNQSVLQSIVSACDNAEVASENIGPGGKLSVAVSLPAVSTAASSASAVLRKSLSELLTFVTGDDVATSDLKDWSFVEDALDALYSRIDESLAAESGTERRTTLSTPSLEDSAMDDRPQTAWKDLIDNARTHFVPILKEKLNAVVPLDPAILRAQSDKSITVDFGNVYEREIAHALGTLRKSEVEFRQVVDFEPMDSTDVILVNSVEKLDDMIQTIIDRHSEIAIDLEHHDIHSFRGFTCLIQISTRTTDYIVDPFPLFHDLGRLNKVTTDPKIIKVLHGADMDIQWLQRDFGVYIVNMFDTGQAARVLGLAGGFGLANLLDTFCKVQTNKKFQTSDWRIRPLPADMLRYARIDTHYLLFIFDKLWNALLSLGGGSASAPSSYGVKMLIQVLEKSAGIASKVWKDFGCDFASEATQLCLKSPAIRVGSIRQKPKSMAILRAVLKWRDCTARRLDESRHYVLSNAAVLRLAAAQPPSAAQILRHLSFEKGNAFMPAMKISTAMADDLMAEIESELNSIRDDTTRVETPDSVVLTEERTITHRRHSSVVSAGRESFGKIEKMGPRRVSEPLVRAPGKHANIKSALFELFVNEASATTAASEKRDQIIAAISHYLDSVPESVQHDLNAWIAAASSTEPQADEIVMEDDHTPLVTEFVAFQNAPKRKIDWENGEIPMTVNEERKIGESAKGSKRPSKSNKLSSAASESGKNAAIKALEFIENEIGIGIRKTSRS